MIHSELFLLNVLFHRCLNHCISACLCWGQQQCSSFHVSSSLGGRDKTLPLVLQTFTPTAFLLPVRDLWSCLIISLHQTYPQPHLCVLVKFLWADAAHQTLMYMPAPHLEDLGLADAWKSKTFIWLSLPTPSRTGCTPLPSEEGNVWFWGYLN